MSYASDCIRTLDFLLRKHDKLLREAQRSLDTLKCVDTRDKPSASPLTQEEHDRILELCRTTKLSNVRIARQVGRSPTVVAFIRLGKHVLSRKKEAA